MALDLSKLIPYRKALRPVDPSSLPQFVDNELSRLTKAHAELLQVLKDHDARLTLGGL